MFKKILSQQYSFFIALSLHLLVLFLVFFQINHRKEPILSFNVSINDLAVNPNNISITNITNSQEPIKKQDQIIEEDKKSEKQKKFQRKKLVQLEQVSQKSKTDNVVDSKQQSAVFANETPAIFDASYLQNPTPSYPVTSRRLKEEGLVLLSVYVNNAGNVEKIEIKKSSGFERLDNTALNTVKNWRFIAAKKDQQFVSSWVQVPINFILEK